MSRRSTSRWSGRRFPRLAVWPLEGRDLPHGLAPLPDGLDVATFVGPRPANHHHRPAGVAGHANGDHDQTSDTPQYIALESDPSMQAVGPFFMSPSQLNPPGVGSIPGAGPDGPLAPIAITYTTNAAGLPQLTSSTTSPANIYLDFDGDGSNLPYDTNGDTATFDTTEQAVIVEAWRQISVYFSMFDVNVTTVFPSGPKVWELISNSISGGYSYVNVFPNSSPRSFNQSSDARTRLSGIAHEIGHNFGLSHQSDYNSLAVKTNEYSSGWTMHGPIIGVDYAQNAHKWFVGHPSGSGTTLQDDISVISNKIKPYQGAGGDGFRPDEHGNTIANASDMELLNGYFRGWGVIERLNDADVFTFDSTGGVYNITANQNNPSGMNIKMEVFDAAGNRLAAADGPNNDQLSTITAYGRNVTMTLPAGTYYVLVSSHGDYSDVGAYDVSARPMPTGWATQDIGTVITGGFAGVNPADGTWRVGGSGSDIWSTSDHFRYAYLPLTGDGTITARVATVENTNSDAKVGVMIRETLANNSRNGFMLLKPSSAAFQYRTSTGGSTSQATSAATAPRWVQLTRVGNTVTGRISSDGLIWTTVGSATISMAAQVYIGLAVTSHNTSAVNVLNESTFDNVTTLGNTSVTPPVYNSLDPPANLVATLGTGIGINLSWDLTVGADSYAIDRSADGVIWTQIANTANGATTTYSDTSLPSGGLRYFYRVAARIGTTRSAESTVVSIVNRPSAPTNFNTASASTSTIVLNWRDSGGDAGYRVERSTDGTNWTALATVGTNIPSYTNSGLSSASIYQYRIVPLSAFGDGLATSALTESTRLPAVTSLAFYSIASTSMAIQWLPVSSATAYRVDRSTDGTNYTTLATTPVVNYIDTTVTAQNEYYYRVAAINAYSESSSMPVIFASTPATSKPPAPWDSQDIGSVGGVGTTGYSGSTFTLIGSGSDIGGTTDSFHFASQLLVGDGTITAKVATLENSGNSEVGVMIRESTASNSKMVAVVITPAAGATFIRRTSTGATAATSSDTVPVAPYWVRVTREGSSFSGYISSDGTNWTQIGSAVTITMSTNARAGLAVGSGGNTVLNKSTLNNVTLAQGDILPAVYSSTPSGRVAGPISSVDLVFTESMNAASFSTAADLTSFTGPAGNLLPFVTGYSWPTSSTLRLTFAAQSIPGDYAIKFGSQILSTTDQALDQDRNGTPGQASDAYTVSFRLGGVAPDAVGYVYSSTTYDASLNLDPAAAGVVTLTALSNNDDAAATINLGTESFRIYDTNYTGNNLLYVSSNGHITFGSSDTSYQNGDLSSPSPRAIFPLWDNLRTNQNTTTDDLVLYQFQDTTGDSKADRLVINWRNVHYYSASAATDDGITFQAVLELNTGTRNGEVTVNYTDIGEVNTGAENNAGAASVGIKNTGSPPTNKVVISQNTSTTPEIGTGKALKVFVNRAPTANAGSGYVLGGGDTVQLSGAGSSDPDQTTASLNYVWDFDGDGIFGETGATAAPSGDEVGMTPTFNGQGLSGGGQVVVALRTIDAFGRTGDATTTIGNPLPLTVASYVVGDGLSHRSEVNAFKVIFSGLVTIADPQTAFTIDGPNGAVPFTVSFANSTQTETIANLSFADLDDGRYTLTIHASGVLDSYGQMLDGNGDGTSGDDATIGFHRLYGDANGDATITQDDFIAFRNAMNGNSTIFDFDNSGFVDQTDFVAFRNRFGSSV